MFIKKKVRYVLQNLIDLELLRERRFAEKKLMLPKVPRVEISQSEPWMHSLLEFLVENFGAGLLDVGVNLGQTLTTYRLIDAEGEYLGLEPNASCVAYAEHLAEVNGFKNIRIIPCALASSAGLMKLDFYQDIEHDSSASIIPNFRPEQKVELTKIISSITYQHLQQNFDLTAFNIIKIDVEGAEAIVLTELASLLKQSRPMLVAEILPPYTKDNNQRIEAQASIKAVLNSSDYAIYRLLRDCTRLFGFQKCQEFGVHSDLLKSDYVFVPKEKQEALEGHCKSAELMLCHDATT